MELEKAIITRRSIRKYSNRLVEKEVIEKIIEAGTWAPSACNVQGWRFIVIDDKSILNNIVNNGAATFLRNINQAIVVIYDNRSDNTEYSDYIQSASACIENMLLMATSLSVGTCWVNFLPSKSKLRKLLQIPPCFDPIALISLGYYDQELNERARKYEKEEIISWNKFNAAGESFGRNNISLNIKRLVRKIYFFLPITLKKKMSFILDKKEKKFDN